MENKDNVTSIEEQKIELRKCKICGKELPINEFSVFGKRHRKICKHCENKEYTTSDRFKDVLSRDLILELRARGYIGKLQLKRIIIEDVAI